MSVGIRTSIRAFQRASSKLSDRFSVNLEADGWKQKLIPNGQILFSAKNCIGKS